MLGYVKQIDGLHCNYILFVLNLIELYCYD